MKNGLVKHYLICVYRKILKMKHEIEKIYTDMYIKYCKINPTKIVFSNFLGRGYGDNPKYITEEILRQNLEWDLVWLTDDINYCFPEKIRVVQYGSLAAMRELASAKIWIDNVRNSKRPQKKKEQIYLQTWHGGIGFKKVERAVEESLSKEYVLSAKKDGQQTDAIISDCKLKTNLYLNDFWLREDVEVLEVGQPRSDILFSEDKSSMISKVKKYFNIPDDKKVILYVPTFRDDLSKEGYDIDAITIIESFKKRFGGEFVFLVRLHPNVQEQANGLRYDKNVINATKYPDVQELYIASDFLITDYSSTAFDFSLLNKPVFLYASDYENYEKNRKFILRPEETPYLFAKSNEELKNKILSFSYESYERDLQKFRNDYWKPYDEGLASYNVVNWLKKKCYIN